MNVEPTVKRSRPAGILFLNVQWPVVIQLTFNCIQKEEGTEARIEAVEGGGQRKNKRSQLNA